MIAPDAHSKNDFSWNDRKHFMVMALCLEGAVLVAAIGLGWVFGIDPWESFRCTFAGILWGLFATVPLLCLMYGILRSHWLPIVTLCDMVVRILGPPLRACRWYDRLVLAAMAGLCEELMFRGFLQVWLAGDQAASMGSIRFVVALLGSNLVFGLLHPLTCMYVLLVAATGCYLGVVGWLDPIPETGHPNLIVPVIAHGVYDWIAFTVIVRKARLSQFHSITQEC